MVDTHLQRLVSTQVYLSTKAITLPIICLPARQPLLSREELEDDRRRKQSRRGKWRKTREEWTIAHAWWRGPQILPVDSQLVLDWGGGGALVGGNALEIACWKEHPVESFCEEFLLTGITFKTENHHSWKINNLAFHFIFTSLKPKSFILFSSQTNISEKVDY